MGRLHQQIDVPAADRRELERLLRATTTPQRTAVRARIILMCGEGMTVGQVTEQLGIPRLTFYKWRARYERGGIAALEDAKRSGRPRSLPSWLAKKTLHDTVHCIPREATHWSTRLMAKHAGVSFHQVREVWAAADLKPHRLSNFKISRDPDFAEKVCDVVGLYLNPPENALVLSVDEKTQIQALDRTQPMLPLKPGQVQRRTHDYKRNGTRSLYAAFDIATGQVLGRVTKRHRAREFLSFLRQIDRATRQALDIHLVLDNSSTHKTAEVRAWFEKHPRFQVHFTPTSASWLNAVEGWFSQLERRSLHRGVFTNVTELRDEIHRYIRVHNDEVAKPFVWTKSAESIIEKVDRVRSKFGN
jgi:transposase